MQNENPKEWTIADADSGLSEKDREAIEAAMYGAETEGEALTCADAWLLANGYARCSDPTSHDVSLLVARA